MKTEKGFTVTERKGAYYIDGVLMVNKTYPLSPEFGDGLTPETEKAFEEMKADGEKLGLDLYNSSGFRSYDYQNKIYNEYVEEDGRDVADTYSARPGHSEHQSGLAFDLNTISDEFADTEEGKWVNDNCWKYGFILRFPKGKNDITGYKYEPWHMRFVGRKLAEKMYNGGDWLTLEEYFGVDSRYEHALPSPKND